MQNWYKNVFVDATLPFQLPYMQIWTALSNRDYTGSNRSSSPPKYVSVLRELPNKFSLWKPIDTRLDMSDANVQKHPFSNLPAV